MENFYMKYETAFLSNYELNELLPLLNKWKENLNEEKNAISNEIANMINKNVIFTSDPNVLIEDNITMINPITAGRN